MNSSRKPEDFSEQKKDETVVSPIDSRFMSNSSVVIESMSHASTFNLLMALNTLEATPGSVRQESHRLRVGFELYHLHDPDQFEKKIYLVHCSAIAPRNGEIIAGMVLNGQISSANETIRARPTLHHSFGRVVPSFNHVTKLKIWDTEFKTSTHLDEDPNVFAYLEPLQAFRGELLGGETYDFRTLDRHVYGSSAIFIAPLSRIDELRKANPNFQGRILSYNPGQKKLSQVVKEVLETESAWTFEYSFKNSTYFHEIDGHPIPYTEISKLFKELNWDFENGGNYLVPLENSLKLLNEGFFRHAKDCNVAIASHLPPIDVIQILVKQARFYLEQLERATIRKNLSTHVLDKFIDWISDMKSWLGLFEIEIQLRQQLKSIFIENPSVSDVVRLRQNSKKLAEFQGTLSILSMQTLLDHETRVAQDQRWNFLVLVENNDFPFQENPSSPLENKMRAYSLFKSLLEEISSTSQPSEITQAQASQAFSQITLSVSEKRVFQNLWVEFLKTTSLIQDDLALVFINTPLGLIIWNKIARESNSGSVITVNHFLIGLYLFYDAWENLIYLNPNHPNQFKANLGAMHKAWLARNRLPKTIAELFERKKEIELFEFEILHPIYCPDLSEGLNSTYKAIKNGTYGSLSEVFALLGLKTEFKLQFPNENLFWQYTNQTISDVARNLALTQTLRQNFLNTIEENNTLLKQVIQEGELDPVCIAIAQNLAHFYETGDAKKWSSLYKFPYHFKPNLPEAKFWNEIIAKQAPKRIVN